MPIDMKVDGVGGVVPAAGTQFRGEVIGLEPFMKAPAGPTATSESTPRTERAIVGTPRPPR